MMLCAQGEQTHDHCTEPITVTIRGNYNLEGGWRDGAAWGLTALTLKRTASKIGE
jgi:hypothetical protein